MLQNLYVTRDPLGWRAQPHANGDEPIIQGLLTPMTRIYGRYIRYLYLMGGYKPTFN